jgi:hypothetical protein
LSDEIYHCSDRWCSASERGSHTYTETEKKKVETECVSVWRGRGERGVRGERGERGEEGRNRGGKKGESKSV